MEDTKNWILRHRLITAYFVVMLMSLAVAFRGGSPPVDISMSPSQTEEADLGTLPDFGSFLPRKFHELQMESPEMRSWSFHTDKKTNWSQLQKEFQAFIGPSWRTPPEAEELMELMTKEGMFGDLNPQIAQFTNPSFPGHTLVLGLMRGEFPIALITLVKIPVEEYNADF